MQNNMELIYRQDVLLIFDVTISCIKEEIAEANDETLKLILNSVANMYTKTRTIISGVPSVDAEPVRHGYWITRRWGVINHREEVCSECQKWGRERSPFCPNCGAKMDLKE